MVNITPISERTELSPFNVFNEFANRWFGNGFPPLASRLPETFRSTAVPPVNVSETEKMYVISVELPGLEEKDIQIQLMGNQLTINGERKWEEEKKGKEFHRVESQYGSFSRTLILPENLRFESADAVYKRGVLTINFPKVEPTPATKIKVKAAD